MTIALGGDHAGYNFKALIRDYLVEKNYTCLDFGTFNDASVDYPDFAHLTADAVESQKADFGIVVCGSGNGVTITANKHAGIRCALCWQIELAILARAHNNANMLAIPARFITLETAFLIIDAFLITPFEGGRHAKRVNKISC